VDKLQTPSTLKVHLKASKTDPFRVGVHIVVGKVEDPLCPVLTVLDYLLLDVCVWGGRRSFILFCRWKAADKRQTGGLCPSGPPRGGH